MNEEIKTILMEITKDRCPMCGGKIQKEKKKEGNKFVPFLKKKEESKP